MKFIELTKITTKKNILINIGYIIAIDQGLSNGCRIYFREDSWVDVQESYFYILEMIDNMEDKII